MVHSTFQHPPPTHPPPHSHILFVYTVRGGGGRTTDRRYSRGATVHKYSSFVKGGNSSQAGSKIQTIEWMYLQSIKSVKQKAAKSVNRSTERKADIVGCGVFIVHLSMVCGIPS
jgi:hypothetical protein